MENTRQNYFTHKGKKVCSGSSIHYKGEHFDEEGTLSKYVSLYGTFLYIDGDLMYIQSFDNKVYYCKEYDEDHIIVHKKKRTTLIMMILKYTLEVNYISMESILIKMEKGIIKDIGLAHFYMPKGMMLILILMEKFIDAHIYKVKLAESQN